MLFKFNDLCKSSDSEILPTNQDKATSERVSVKEPAHS